jgi:3-hydroxybutyryl-CoA dehydratase
VFDFEVGQSAALTRTFTRDEVRGFSELVGGLQNATEVPHGLVGGLFSTLLGTQLPGRGTNWMKQSLRFHARARVDDALTASVEIIRLRPEKQLVNLRCRCHASDGKLVCEGDALVLAREMF